MAAQSLVDGDLGVEPESEGAGDAHARTAAVEEANSEVDAPTTADQAADSEGGSTASTDGDASKQPSRTRRALRELFSAPPPTPDAPAVPKRFVAEVTAHRDLVRDRQLLVLDGLLLFEGDNAASSRISVGDEVQVVKSSSMRGRRYRIMGPSKRPFDALRIRCEERDLNVDNRRKCERLLGQ